MDRKTLAVVISAAMVVPRGGDGAGAKASSVR